jgi:NitT/TauT family transport system substrate-binding protein
MRKSIVRLTSVLAGIAMLAACGGTGGTAQSSPATTATAAPATLNVGVVGVIDVAPLFLGIQKGFFAKQQLTITPKVLNTGATVVAGVVAGDLQLGFSNITSIVIAASNRFPVHIVAAGNQAAGGDYSAVYVRQDSPITSAKDLVGKKVAVNGLKNIGSLCVNAALQASHVDYNGVTYVEVPFPQMGAALAQGTVDAVWTVEPWSTVVKAGGTNRVVLRPFTLIAKNFPIASYFTSTQYMQSNAGVVRRFKTAINESLNYAQAHPAEARAVLSTYIKLAPGLQDQVLLPFWHTDLETNLIQKTADLAVQYGYTTRKPDMKQLLGT